MAVLRDRLTLVVLVSALCFAGEGQADDKILSNWRFFTSADGLTESWSRFISIGPSGRVWVAHGGIDSLSYLDGWPSADGLLVHKIPSPGRNLVVKESNSGQLWSLYSNGIQLFQNDRWIQFRIEEINNPLFQDVAHKFIPFLPGGQNKLFYLMPDRLMLFDAGLNRTDTVLSTSDTRLGEFTDLTQSHDGSLWISGDNGLVKLDMDLQSGEIKSLKNIAAWGGRRHFSSPTVSDSGRLFVVATRAGEDRRELLIEDKTGWHAPPGQPVPVLLGWPGLEGGYWTLSEGDGLCHVLENGYAIKEQEGILSGEILDVQVERDGIFWVGTSYGLARYSPPLWRTPTELLQENEIINSICEDREGRVWVCTNTRLLIYENGRWRTYEMPKGIYTQDSGAKVFFPLADGRMGINVYYYKHLLVFSPERERFEFIPYSDPQGPTSNRSILKGALGRDGKLWIVTYAKSDSIVERIELYDGKEFKPVVSFPEDYVIQCLLEDREGGLWIGSPSHDHGLGLLKDGEFKQFGPGDGYEGGGVFDIIQLADGRILVTGRDALYAYDGKRWEPVRKGLDVTFAVKEVPGGDLWVASGTGVHRLHDGCWITYTSEDGLPNTAASAVLPDSRGRVWAGTIHGLSLFHPEADPDPPKTLILQRDNPRQVPPKGEARLQFAGADKWNHTRPSRLLFSYRLDDAEWSPFRTGNVAWFNDLPYGAHRFEVRAMDVNLNADPYPTGFEFTVLLPWYRETAFQVVASIGGTVIVLLLGFAVHRHLTLERLVKERTKDLHTEYQARLEAEQKQTEAVKMAEKASRLASIGVMAAGITHEINQPLNTMRIISEGALMDYEQDNIVSTSEEYLGMIRKIFTQVLRISKIIEHMKEFWIAPARIEKELCSLNDAVAGALSLIETQIRSHGIELRLELGQDLPPVQGNRIHLEQIVINLTVNAIHALDQVEQPGKEITILTTERDGRVVLEVADNGKGFAEGDEDRIFDAFYSTKEPGQGAGLGLAIVLKFVESFHGTILARNEQGGGAKFRLDFPPA
ncbi:hypothetical protein LLH00_02425 [bacterium]|nr:hypothetical protein [bacterium]